MEQARLSALIVPVLVSLSLTACGGGSSGSNSSSSSSSVVAMPVIASFKVTGSYVDNTTTAVPISASMNGGAFGLDWALSSGPSLLRADVFLSADNTIDGSDINILGQNCGDNSSVYDCTPTSGSFTCSFTTANRITCDTVNDHSIATFVASGLPKSAYLLFRACDGLQENCATKGEAIRLE